MAREPESKFAQVPMQWVGPLSIFTSDATVNPDAESINVPLATFESPLWPSVNRGARVTAQAGGIRTTLVRAHMTRSILLEARDAATAKQAWYRLLARRADMDSVVASTSRFARLVEMTAHPVARQLFIRLVFETGDAAGHNMVTKAADAVQRWIVAEHADLKYVSISGNLCTDKKVSAVNSLAGRGRHVIAEAEIPARLCRRFLRCAPQELVNLNTKKNLLGSLLAGSVCSANAHVANMLLGFYLATGQDAANIVEGSQAITFAEVSEEGSLQFSVSLPNLILGTVGNGKGLDFACTAMQRLGCLEAEQEPGVNAMRLARICAATVLCGELSLLAAQTNPGELMAAHERLERKAEGTST